MEFFRIEDPDLAVEVKPYRNWLVGSVLNAGCGKRWIDLGPSSIRVDKNPGFAVGIDVICDVHLLPFSNHTFDSILSVAVLEHTRFPWEVAKEYYRVLKPGGHAVVCIPFMQPIHGAPEDYSRFTGEGLRALMEWAGFKIIQVKGAHPLGYTLEWILREIIVDHPVYRFMLWPIRRFLFPLMKKGTILSNQDTNLQSAYYVIASKY